MRGPARGAERTVYHNRTRMHGKERERVTADGGAGRLADRWDDAQAAAMTEPERLLYRSNLLGSDLRITNFGGGNTSAKIAAAGPAHRRGRRPCCGSRARAATSAR